MAALTITLPLPSDQVEVWRRFCQELQTTQAGGYRASRRRAGITYERFDLVRTAFGVAVAVTIEADDMATAVARLAASRAPFDRWFKTRVRHYHGLDLAPGPAPEQLETVFEWRRDAS